MSWKPSLKLNYILGDVCSCMCIHAISGIQSKCSAHLIKVQRGVITERTDGRQFHQSIKLGALHQITILVPEVYMI